MTATGAQAPARVPTPRPKASPTASVTPESAAAVISRSGAASPAPGAAVGGAGGAGAGGGAAQRRSARPTASDPLSDRTTAFLIRRTLYPKEAEKGRNTPAPIEEVLPPLTSRNDVDLQLYALFSIILREYVQAWYNKITPDETFVAEIVQILAHITRALEQRLRKVDLESLLFDEIPDLLDKHITAYRAAQNPISWPPLHTNHREIYHSLCPLPALSPVPKHRNPSAVTEQAENEAAYRQLLVQGVLAILLPTEDLENECLTALVGQILSELIIGNVVANKLAEPWMIWECFIILARVLGRKNTNDASPGSGSVSTAGARSGGNGFSLQRLFWSFIQWCFAATTFIRVLVTTLFMTSSLPSRAIHYGSSDGVSRHKSEATEHTDAADPAEMLLEQPTKTPVLAFRCWTALSNLVELDVRMPWLSGAISMLQWTAITGPGRIADVDGVLDRLLSHYIARYVLDPAALPPLLRTVRGALFPNNAPGTSSLVAPASDAELRALRRRCASALWALVPRGVGRLYFAGRGATTGASPSATVASSPPPPPVADVSDPRGGSRGHAVDGDNDDDDDVAGSRRSTTGRAPPAPDADKDRDKVKNEPDDHLRDPLASAQQQQGITSQPRSGPTSGGDQRQRTRRPNVHFLAQSPPSLSPPPPLPHVSKQGIATAGGASASANASGSGSGSSKHSSASSLASTSTSGNAPSAGQRGSPTEPPGVQGRKQAPAFATPASSPEPGVGDGYAQQQGPPSPSPRNRDEEMGAVMGGHDDEQILADIETGILDVFGDVYCNKHLLYAVVELVLVRLMPELAEKGVVELWEERL